MDDDSVELCAARVYADMAALNDDDFAAAIARVQQIRAARPNRKITRPALVQPFNAKCSADQPAEGDAS